MKEAERAKERREEDMKDVILIAMCISVTDAYYYDISNDFNCLKTLLRTLSHSLFGLLSVEHKIILQLHQNIRQSVRNEKSKSQKFSIYLNLYRIMLGESWFNHLFCILLLLFEMFIVSSSRKRKKVMSPKRSLAWFANLFHLESRSQCILQCQEMLWQPRRSL